jgi:hypothetical protein
MKSRFHDAAAAELTEAVAYYDGKASGLGDRLLAEVKAATRLIERYPEIAPVVDLGVRARALSKFPYNLIYVVEPEELFVLAVAHLSRRPGYWADRIPETTGG